MKLPQPSTRGSFGIPEEIHPDTLRKKRDAEAKPADRTAPDQEFSAESMDLEDDDETDDSAAMPRQAAVSAGEKAKPLLSPLQNLKEKLGVELTGEDFQRLVFKGYIEKTIKLAVNPVTKEPITATFRTLTPGEYDELDECLAEECANIPVTRDGMEQRRASWTMAFALWAIDGKPFVKPIMKKDPDLSGELIDTKATAKLRKKYIKQLNTLVVNKALRIWDTLTANLTQVVEDPEAVFFVSP